MDAMRVVAMACLATVLGACASGAEYRAKQDARLATYERFAGAPVKQIRMYTGLDHWDALAPDRLVVFLGVNRAYLLSLRAPCSGLEFQQAIGISSSNGVIHARFDKVTYEHQVCYIEEIRPVDYKGLKRERMGKPAED
ncbi:MAG: hypothetical protein JNL89_00285 [Rhodanobacteraceae bacterium]|nr:hypothetical protein [Rhodanobacteraceae bacterium]